MAKIGWSPLVLRLVLVLVSINASVSNNNNKEKAVSSSNNNSNVISNRLALFRDPQLLQHRQHETPSRLDLPLSCFTATVSRLLTTLGKQSSRQSTMMMIKSQQQPPALLLWGLVAAAVGTRRMIISNNNNSASKRALYFWFHAGPIVAHYKFAKWWLTSTRAPLEKRDRVYNSLHNRYSVRALNLSLHLKGLYVKLGQVLASRPDFMPSQYVEQLSTLQDGTPQLPLEKIKTIIADSLRKEHGLEFDDVFDHMDEKALGCASIGQVHQAILKETTTTTTTLDSYYKKGGKEVAVKVMHPGAKECFVYDFQVFRWLCRVALPGWSPLLRELEERIMTEFDFRMEARSLQDIREQMKGASFANSVCVPEPFLPLCTERVVVMEMLRGKKLAVAFQDKLVAALGGNKQLVRELLHNKQRALLAGETAAKSIIDDESVQLDLLSKLRLFSLQRTTRRYLDLVVDVHGHQIFVTGCFNGDAHPGNILLLDDGRLGLIDFGQTRRLLDRERMDVALIVKTLQDPSRVSAIASAMRNAGFRTRTNDDEFLAKYAILFFDSDHQAMEAGFTDPQGYFASLMESDPLEDIPGGAIFVARVSFMFRGFGSVADFKIKTASRWLKFAQKALEEQQQVAVLNHTMA